MSASKTDTPSTAVSGGFLSSARVVPAHGFSVGTMCRKRYRENTSSLAVTVGFILPTLTAVNKELEKCANSGSDVAMDEIVDIFTTCGKASAFAYADRLARVTCQTAFACLLIKGKTELGDSMVYLWDLYPRLMYRYVGELFSLFRLPRFLSTLLGPAPTAQDMNYLEHHASPVNAFCDSLKRNVIFLVGDAVVDTARIALDSRTDSRDKPVTIAMQLITRATTTLCWACGAAVGRAAAGERGEYWGEYLGTSVAPVVVLKLMLAINLAQKNKGRRGSGSGGSKGAARPHRTSSSSHRSHSASKETSSAPAV